MQPTQTDQPPDCPLGLSSVQLSTWRARGLDAAESERVAAHVLLCPACQSQLSAYDGIGEFLRGHQAPTADWLLWDELEPRLAWRSYSRQLVHAIDEVGAALRSAWREHRTSSGRGELPAAAARIRPVGSPAMRLPRGLSALVAAAALLMLIAGFAAVLSQEAGPAALPLIWQRGTMPSGMSLGMEGGFDSWVADSDGNTAYACTASAGATQTQLQVWVTHDRAAKWTTTSTLPQTAPNFTHCGVIVDNLEPSTAIVFASASVEGRDAAYATFDGGTTWRPLPAVTLTITEIATWHGETYAATQKGIVVSHDRMQSWRTIGPPMTGQIPVIGQFWIRPDTGDLLVSVIDYGRDRTAIWTSTNGGKSWSQMLTPMQRRFTVQQPLAGQSWHLCGWPYPSSSSTPTSSSDSSASISLPAPTSSGSPATLAHVECSWDGGHSWAGYEPPLTSNEFYALAMTNNGDLLAEGTTASSNTLYRLVAATGRWQSLGVPPGDWTSPLIYSTGPESGVLWRVVTELAGNVTPVQTARDLPVVGIYTVDYPSP